MSFYLLKIFFLFHHNYLHSWQPLSLFSAFFVAFSSCGNFLTLFCCTRLLCYWLNNVYVDFYVCMIFYIWDDVLLLMVSISLSSVSYYIVALMWSMELKLRCYFSVDCYFLHSFCPFICTEEKIKKMKFVWPHTLFSIFCALIGNWTSELMFVAVGSSNWKFGLWQPVR